MTETLQSPVVYVDANTFIYAIEGDEPVAEPVRQFFSRLRDHPGYAVTSELTLAEVLPKTAKPDIWRSYFNLIVWSGIFVLESVSREILVETANYRRRATILLPDGRASMPKLPDSIHVVTAVRCGCTTILSADSKLRLPSGIDAVEPNDKNLSTLIQAFS